VRALGLDVPGTVLALSYEVIADLGARLKAAVETSKMLGRVGWTDAAAKKWVSVYSALSAPQPGLLGAATARGEAQVVRLALLYALLDGTSLIAPEQPRGCARCLGIFRSLRRLHLWR